MYCARFSVWRVVFHYHLCPVAVLSRCFEAVLMLSGLLFSKPLQLFHCSTGRYYYSKLTQKWAVSGSLILLFPSKSCLSFAVFPVRCSWLSFSDVSLFRSFSCRCSWFSSSAVSPFRSFPCRRSSLALSCSVFRSFSCRRSSLALSCSVFRSFSCRRSSLALSCFFVPYRRSSLALSCSVLRGYFFCSSLLLFLPHHLLFSPFRRCSSLTSCLFPCSVAYILHTVPLSPHLFLPHCSFPPQAPHCCSLQGSHYSRGISSTQATGSKD